MLSQIAKIFEINFDFPLVLPGLSRLVTERELCKYEDAHLFGSKYPSYILLGSKE